MRDNQSGFCPYRRKFAGGWYEIRVQEAIDPSWTAWFDGMEVSHEADGTTVLIGLLVDQSALHGVLAKIRDMHLTLLALQRIR